MKKLTVKSQTVYLLNFRPNWTSSVTAEFRILSESERGLTGREDRVQLSSSLRTSLTFAVLLQRAESAEFRAALKELGNAPVLCPFWPAAGGYYDDKSFYTFADGAYVVASDGSYYIADALSDSKTARLSSGLMMVYEPDGSVCEVVDAALDPSFSPSAAAIKVPLLWGRFDKTPSPEAITDGVQSCKINFVENSPVSLAFTAAPLDFVAGPLAAGSARPVFPVRPNWKNGMNFGAANVEMDSEEIGYGRETADVFYPQAARRILEQEFLCASWADIHTLVRFYADAGGNVSNFWVPAFVGDCNLSAASDRGDEFLVVDNAAGLGDAEHLALISPDNVELHNIDSITTDPDVVFLAEPTEAAFAKTSTVVSPLLLARFGRTSLKIKFTTDCVVTSSLQFIELPAEYAEIADDDPGDQQTTAWLYRFSLIGFDDWLFTSHERAIDKSGDVYAPHHFDHSSVTENINLEKSKVTLTSRYFWHDTDVSLRNPLGYFMPFRLEAPLYISITECKLDSSGDITTSKMIFRGQVESANFDGPMIQAKCQNIGAIFDRQIPTLLIQPTCNYTLYGEACGVDAALWQMSAQVVSYDGAYELIVGTPVFTDLSATRPAVSLFEHFFAGGKMEAGSGNTFARRGILDSEANGENLRITIRYPLEQTPASIFLWAGCDGQRTTCLGYDAENNASGKFDNYARFGGFPFAPTGNPSLAKVNRDYSNGGKK